MENYFEHDVTFLDRFENRFVKAALLARGSRKLFSNEKNAKAYLEKLKGESYAFSPGKSRSCRVTKKKHLETEYAVFEPTTGERSKTTVFYLHGGAYVRHITKLHLKMIEKLCVKTGARFVVPAYLTAPGSNFSKSAAQLSAIYLEESKGSEKMIVCGDSCGSAIGVCLLPFFSRLGAPKPEKLLLFSPLLSHEIVNHEMTNTLSVSDPMFAGTAGLYYFINSWACGEELSDPIKTDFSLLPKTYIFTSKGDMLHAGCLDFFEKAKKNGADVRLEIWNDMYHDFVLYPLPCSKSLLKTAEKIIKE